jgi:hypothetical protein
MSPPLPIRRPTRRRHPLEIPVPCRRPPLGSPSLQRFEGRKPGDPSRNLNSQKDTWKYHQFQRETSGSDWSGPLDRLISVIHRATRVLARRVKKRELKPALLWRWALSTLHLSELTLADGQSVRVQAFLSGGMVQRKKRRAQVMQ